MSALGEVLRSADKHFAKLRSKRKLWFTPPSGSDTDDELPPKQPLKKTKASCSPSQKSRKEHEIKRKGKGKAVTAEKRKVKEMANRKAKDKIAEKQKVETADEEEKVLIEPVDDDEADVGVEGSPGNHPKYVLYMETRAGFKKFRVYEDYENFSEEWDAAKHAFLLMKKRPNDESSSLVVSTLSLCVCWFLLIVILAEILWPYVHLMFQESGKS